MARLQAATWVAPDDEIDRGNLLGAANAATERHDRDVSEIVEGPDHADAAIEAARRTGMLVVPEFAQVMPVLAHAAGLVQRAQHEGWRLLLLNVGADSAAPSGARMARFIARLAATGGPHLDGPTPPAALRHRVGGGGAKTFCRSGLLHVECYEAALAAAGVELAEVGSLLEWGAGSGRMTAYLAERAPHAQITAVDTDAEAIAWLAGNLPVQRAAAIPILPPTALDDDAYELVVGHSVFSHLDIEAQDRWLAELARVTRPGGHVAVSINGPAALTWHLEHPLVVLPESVAQACRRDGIAIWRDDGWDKEFYDGYHTTFHRHAYVRERWSRWFDVVSIWEEAALPIQDILVLRARGPADQPRRSPGPARRHRAGGE